MGTSMLEQQMDDCRKGTTEHRRAIWVRVHWWTKHMGTWLHNIGVGLPLTAAYTVVWLDRPWTRVMRRPGEAHRSDATRHEHMDVVAFDLDKEIDGIQEEQEKHCPGQRGWRRQQRRRRKTKSPKLSIFLLLKSVLHTAEKIIK